MIEDRDPKPEAPSLWERIRGAVAANQEAAAITLYALIAISAMVAAYLAIFTQFEPFDDEGTLLVTIKAFAHGEVLYRDIYTSYGPFYYELFGGLVALTGHAVTTDASRTLVILIWVSASLLFGLATQRLTGMLMLGATGMIVAFGTLAALVGSPMHPQGLCVLLLGALVLLVVSGPGRRVWVFGGACGALIAALALTKINIGVFAVAAVALAAVLSVEPLQRRRWIRWPVIAAFLAMPVLIMARDAGQSWVRDLVAIEILAGAALVVAAWSSRPRAEGDDATVLRWLLAAAAGFACVSAAIVGIVLLTGPSVADVYEGIIGDAIRIRDALVTPYPILSTAVDWGIAAVAAAVLAVRARDDGSGHPSIWSGLLRGAAGLTIWITVARVAPFSLNPSGQSPDTLPMVLAWVAAIPPATVQESGYLRFLRIFLPALAVAETLQVYPVAGAQTAMAAVIFVPVGALCLGDALICMRAWSAARGPSTLNRFGAATSVLTVALAGMFVLNSILQPAATSAVIYREQSKLPIAGASLMRLPAAEVETYVGLVHLLHRYHCSTFIGYPSIDSLYLWSGLDAPAPQIPNAWMKAFDRDQQQRVVDELRASRRPCAIRSEDRANLYLGGQPPPELPLVHYVLNDFRSVAQVGDFQFLLPKARR